MCPDLQAGQVIDSRPVQQPTIIPSSRGVEGRSSAAQVAVLHRDLCGHAEPLVDFGVAVSKRESSRAIVIGGGNVAPVPPSVAGRVVQEISIVYRIRMFVEEDEIVG